jgi:hypothetical protein
MTLIRPAAVGLTAAALSLGAIVGSASAGAGVVPVPGVTTEAVDTGGPLIRVDHKRHHKRHHARHHGHGHGGHHNSVVIIEQNHYAPPPVYRERVEHHYVETYHYVEPRPVYLVDPLLGGVTFVFSFD